MIDLYDHILGGLIGVAVGDAFGMPSEMWSQRHIRQHFGWITDFLPGPDDNLISRGLRRGEVTDDTMNTVFVVDMLAETQGLVDPMRFISKLRQWAYQTPKSSAVIGPSTARAFAQLDAGVPISETGKTGTTNGAAMKILPLGLIANLEQVDILIDNVASLCQPTHNTAPAISGAAAIAAAASYALHGQPDIDLLLDYAVAAAVLGKAKGMDIGSPSVAQRIEWGRRLVQQAHDEMTALHDLYDLIGTGLPSVESVPAALSLVYLAKGDPMKCAQYSANIGGDTDTIGAMACGICGTYSGANAFSSQTIQLLEQVNSLSFRHLADVLYNLNMN